MEVVAYADSRFAKNKEEESRTSVLGGIVPCAGTEVLRCSGAELV